MIGAAGLVLARASAGLGLLSDDHVLASVAATRASVLEPLEPHHVSLPIQALFASLAADQGRAAAWHGAVVAVHLLSAAILHRAARALGLERTLALLAAGLFAATPAGVEAVLWLAAAGYVFASPWTLLALERALARGRSSVLGTGLSIGALQVGALLSHDTGIFLAPVLAAFLACAGQGPLARRAKVAIPAVAAALGVSALKHASGWVAAAYGTTHGPLEAAKAVLVGPCVCLVPCGQKSFYGSPAGVGLALGILALLGIGARRSAVVRASLLGYLVTVVPSAVLATPQSRYLYVPSAFVALAVAATLGALVRSPRWRRALAAALVTLSIVAAAERAAWFEGARREADATRAQIESLPASARPLVIVDLPDRYGPGRAILRPYVWRNGAAVAVGRPFTAVNVPGADFTWEESPIPLLARAAVRERFPEAAIFEFVPVVRPPRLTFPSELSGGALELRLVPFDPGR